MPRAIFHITPREDREIISIHVLNGEAGVVNSRLERAKAKSGINGQYDSHGPYKDREWQLFIYTKKETV